MRRSPQSRARAGASIQALLSAVTILDFDTPSAEAAGDVRASLAANGRPIGPYDLLLSGVALAHGLTVITGNHEEFLRVPGLSVETWGLGEQ